MWTSATVLMEAPKHLQSSRDEITGEGLSLFLGFDRGIAGVLSLWREKFWRVGS